MKRNILLGKRRRNTLQHGTIVLDATITYVPLGSCPHKLNWVELAMVLGEEVTEVGIG